jgi:hypothetical protein
VAPISSRAFRALWLGSAIAMSTLCLLVTLFERSIPTEGWGNRLHAFSLRGERGVGAWASGMLLLLAAVHALDGYFVKDKRSRVEYAWGAIGLMLALLSIDEVASLHERLDSWAALAPFGVVLIAMAAFGCSTLWGVREEQVAGRWIAVALCMFASVAGQEHLENNPQWWDSFGALRAFLEEGTEMAAMVLLLGVCMRKSSGLFLQRGTRGPVFDALVRAPGVLLVAGLMAAPVVSYVAVQFADPGRGDLALWLATASFFLAALCAARAYPAASASLPWTQWAIALLCVLLSFDGIRLGPTVGPLSHLLLTLGPLLICALWYVSFSHARYDARMGFVSAAIAALVLISWLSTSAWLVHFVYTAVGVLTLYGTSRMAQPQPTPDLLVPLALRVSET